MGTPGKIRQRQQRKRDKERLLKQREKVQKAIDTMPPEFATDSKLSVSPPLPHEERPRINWDIGKETNDLMEAHAALHGVTLDEILYEVGVQYFIGRPNLYWAMKSAKITVSNN